MRTADEEDASCFSAAQLVLAAEMADECADCAVCAAARADGCSALLRCRLPVNGAAGSSSVDSSSSSSVDVGEQVAEWTDLSANADAATRTAFWTAVGDKLCVRSVRWMATDLLTNRMCDCRSIAGGELDADGSPAATLVTDSLPSTAAAANLSALSLRNVSMGSAALPTARNLTSLTMTGCGLTDVSPLPSAPALKTLNLAGNALSSIPDAIYSQKSLQILDVRSNAIYNEQLNESQFTFLSALEAFSADSDAFQSTNCADGEVSYFASNPAIGVCNPASLAAASESASASGSASTSSSGGGSQRPAIIAGSVAITSGLLIALIAKLASQRRQRKQQIRERSTESSQDNVSAAVDIVMEDIVVDGVDDDWYALLEDDQAQTPKCALQRLSLSQWRRDATFLTLDRPMTEVFKDDGAVVEHSQSQAMWLGRYRDDQVAIRKICTDDGVRNHDLRGAALLARISHPNVLRLVGVSVSPTIGLVVLYEFMDRGDLRTYLQTTRRRQDDQNGVHTAWWGPRRAEIALDVARALMHLHSVQRVAHTRLSARTVLLDHEFSAKISDLDHFQRLPEFGEGHSRPPSVHSVDAVSPELLVHESAASEASDLFSFGMLLVELDTSRQAQVDARAVATVDSLTAEVSAECPAALRILMTACLSPDPQERPTAASVVGVLKSVVAALDEDGASRRRPKKRLS